MTEVNSDVVTGSYEHVVELSTGKVVDYAATYTTSNELLLSNVKSSITLGLPQCRPYDINPNTIQLLCSGPSLSDFKDEIRKNYDNGEKIVTVNGTYKWALDQGYENVNLIMCDPQESNVKFIHKVIDNCVYLLASQVHPIVFDKVKEQRTWLWHCVSIPEEAEILNEYYGGAWHQIVGGTTVALRAISLLSTLGYRKLRIYGMDSCHLRGRHHAFAQEDFNNPPTVDVTYGGRIFECSPWMVYQANSFLTMYKGSLQQSDIELSVAGDGLISWIIEYLATSGEKSGDDRQDSD